MVFAQTNTSALSGTSGGEAKQRSTSRNNRLTQAKINELARPKKEIEPELKAASSKKISQLKINELAAPKRTPIQHF